MTVHKIEVKNGVYYLEGKLLICFYSGGDVDCIGPKSPKKNLHSALYDHYQTSETMKDGDEIANSRGRVIARCEGVHVVMVD